MKIIYRAIAALALSLAGFAPASVSAATTILTATGSGWCQNGSCNNTNTNQISNTYVASGTRDWFAFTLPVDGITSATLSIWNDGSNQTGSGTFDLYAASGISWAGLMNGASIGSIAVSAADTGVGHYVDFTLNATGLSALTNASGNTFIFGGAITGAGQMFGYTGGTPAAKLSLTTSPVPEPATWGMMLLGFGAIGFAMRRTRADRSAIQHG